jgi:hypothetical protein
MEDFKRNSIVRSIKRLFGAAVTPDDYHDLWAAMDFNTSSSENSVAPERRVKATQEVNGLWRVVIEDRHLRPSMSSPISGAFVYVVNEKLSVNTFPPLKTTEQMMDFLRSHDTRQLNSSGHVSRVQWPAKRPA